MPRGGGVGISSRIDNEEERDRLRTILESLLDGGESPGVIARTAAEGLAESALAADLEFLQKLWSVVQLECSKGAVKTLIHEDLPLPVRVLRDLVTSDVEQILVNSEEVFQDARICGKLPA